MLGRVDEFLQLNAQPSPAQLSSAQILVGFFNHAKLGCTVNFGPARKARECVYSRLTDRDEWKNNNRSGGVSIKSSHQKVLEQATREELSACVQLLAQSVVLHRTKRGFVTLHVSAENLSDPDAEDVDAGLFMQGREVLEEALEIVRTQAAERALVEAGPAEARTQLRINVSTPIRVSIVGEARPRDANLQNISWGGAAMLIDAEIVEGDVLRVILPRPQGGSISIESRVLRTWEHQSFRGVSVRFSSLNTRDESRLESILQHMARNAEEAGEREYPRLVQRLDVEFNGIQELRSTLTDISAGGLGITVPNPMPIGQSLQMVISTLDAEGCSLKLRARVVHQKPIQMASGKVYRIGLKFEHPSDELRKRVEELMGKMAAASNN